MRRLRSDIGWSVLLLSLSAGCYLLYFSLPEYTGPAFSLVALAASDAKGTPVRIEREFKVGIDMPGASYYMTDEALQELQEEIYRALKKELASPQWKLPDVIETPYSIARTPMMFVARDLYMDTSDELALKHAISYRLRHRFKDSKRLHSHEISPEARRHFPYRCEIQVKVDRNEAGSGFSTVREARFEFRVESLPFSEKNPPPPAPWWVKDYLPVIQSGTFSEVVTTPGKELACYLQSLGYRNDVFFDVELVVVSTRMRIHMDAKTCYGSGPNPEQAFIISVDRCDVFDGREYMKFLGRGWVETPPRPYALATFCEVEIEFERNISTVLDELIKSTEAPEHVEVRDAFLADQRYIKKIVIAALSDMGLSSHESQSSKYQQAYLCLK